MNMMTGIPLVILSLIGVGFLLFYVLRKGTPKIGTRLNKVIYLKLALYLTVLLFMLSIHHLFPVEMNDQHDSSVRANDFPSLYHMANEGKLSKSAEEYLIFQKEFPTPDELKTLNIQSILSTHNSGNSIHVLIEEEEGLDRIEARLYQTPSYFDGLNITHQIKPYQIEMHSDLIAITEKGEKLMNASFHPEFPFKQFQKEPKEMFEEDLISGEQLVYLLIPEGVTVFATHSNTSLHYVESF